MAVRRISDLPNLTAYYPTAELSDTMIEVSYAKPVDPRRYQSFYSTMKDALQLLVDNLPRATKSQFGIVKIGAGINVIDDGTSETGLISVSRASQQTPGLVKIGNNISVTSDGTISVADANKASSTDFGVVKIGNNIQVSEGVISVKTGSTDDFGVVKVTNGHGLTISNGVISMAPTAGIDVVSHVDFGTKIATITANNTPTDIYNGIDIDSLTNALATAFIPNYPAKKTCELPSGNFQNIGPEESDTYSKHYPTCRFYCETPAYIVPRAGAGVNNTSAGGIARSVDANYHLIDPFSAQEQGYFIPANVYFYTKGPKWTSGGNKRIIDIYPLGNVSNIQYHCEVYCNYAVGHSGNFTWCKFIWNIEGVVENGQFEEHAVPDGWRAGGNVQQQ